MIDWHHPRIYERLRCFGLALFTLGIASRHAPGRTKTAAKRCTALRSLLVILPCWLRPRMVARTAGPRAQLTSPAPGAAVPATDAISLQTTMEIWAFLTAMCRSERILSCSVSYR